MGRRPGKSMTCCGPFAGPKWGRESTNRGPMTPEWLNLAWAVLFTTAHVASALVVTGHAILTKEDVRAAIGWIGLAWLAPLIGAMLYFLFGINRLRRRAGRLRRRSVADETVAPPPLDRLWPDCPHQMVALARLIDVAVGQPLTTGNRVRLLDGGDQAYPAMLAAIDDARRWLVLATYIFDSDVEGGKFVDALARARDRGVAVRVLIDGLGARYKRPSVVPRLRRLGIPVAQFLPPGMSWRSAHVNLRNHRKILVIDGETAFTGGMNIRGECVDRGDGVATADIHARFDGPVAAQMMEVFATDWQFVTGEALTGPDWTACTRADHPGVIARGIADGPDEDFEKLHWTLLGALAQARQTVRIMTPYFLPDAALIAALNLAAMRGVRVEILIPEQTNIRLVQWACRAQIGRVLRWGCVVRRTPPPFDHGKLMLVDGTWGLVGSTNWDPRSLRLNFEFNVECYDPEAVGQMNDLFERRWQRARPLDLAELDARPLVLRLRDGVAWLASPYI